jgi:hypothetical protein
VPNRVFPSSSALAYNGTNKSDTMETEAAKVKNFFISKTSYAKEYHIFPIYTRVFNNFVIFLIII